MVNVDPRLRYLASGRLWPVYWRDVRALTGITTSGTHRVDVLGVAGIGKTTFTQHLTRALGERVPVLRASKALSPEWDDTLGALYNAHFSFMSLDEVSPDDKHRLTAHLTQLVDVERKILRSAQRQILVNGVSLLRHRLAFFADYTENNPSLVPRLFGDRLVILCRSEDPVQRSIEGKKKRGDRDVGRDDLVESVTERVALIDDAVGRLRQRGLRVVEVNLDRPLEENVSVVALFMAQHGMDSRAIRRFS